MCRERQTQEARELEKQHKEREERERAERERQEREKVERERQEREKMERERRQERDRIEKQRAAEQAVHKHFEESLRLAHQKVSSLYFCYGGCEPRGMGNVWVVYCVKYASPQFWGGVGEYVT